MQAAAVASPTLRIVSVRATGVARTASNKLSEPGSVAASLQFAFSVRMARTASHSRGAATARKSRTRTNCACGIAAIEPASTSSNFAAIAGGRMTSRVPHACDAMVLNIGMPRRQLRRNVGPRI